MRFQGNVHRDGNYWLAEVPIFDAMSQGRTRKQALEMIKDWFAMMVDHDGFAVRVHPVDRYEFELDANDTQAMISLLLRRQRHKTGLSLAQAAERLGAKSRNAYARYEQGSSAPTLTKFDELLKAIAPDRDIVVREAGRARHVNAD